MQIPFFDAAFADHDIVGTEALEQVLEHDRRRAHEIEFFGRVVQNEAGTILPRQQVFNELFEFFAADGPDAVRLALIGIFRIDIIDRGTGGAHQNDGGEHPRARQIRTVEFLLDVTLDLLCFLLVRIDIGDKFAVQIEQAEGEAHHLLLARLGKIADLDALAAQIDEHGPLIRLIIGIGNVVAVRFRCAVDEVDGEARRLQNTRSHLVKIPDMAKRRRGDQITALHAQFGARIFEAREHFDEFLRATRGEAALFQIVHKGERGALFEHDFRPFPVARCNDHGKTARADIDDRILHIFLLFQNTLSVFYALSPKEMPMLRAKRTSSPAGSTNLYLPAISVRALKVIAVPERATVTPNFPSCASLAA